MKLVRLSNMIFGSLLFILIYYMVFFVKYPMENDFQQVIHRTLAQNIYRQFKYIFRYKPIDIFIMSSMYLSLFIIPVLFFFVGFKKKFSSIILALLSLCSLISLFVVTLSFFNIGNPTGDPGNTFDEPFIPYIILCSVIAVIIIIQYIVNLFFYFINKRKLKERME